MEIDLTKVQQAFAKTSTTCDYCGETLGSTYPQYPHSQHALTANLRKSPGTVGGYDYSEKEDHHYCGEACMREHLNERAQADTAWKGKPKQMGDKDINKPDALESKASDEELTAEGKITTKERDKAKSSTFLYPETRSYPIRNCADVKNAIHAFGRGGNKDSYSQFLSKLHRKAKSLGLEGCIPESTRQEHHLN